MKIGCFDIGGTHIRSAIITEEGIVAHRKVLTDSSLGITSLREQVTDLYSELEMSSCQALSIGCPGPVCESVMLGSKPLEISENVRFADWFVGRFSKTIFVANDLTVAIHAQKKVAKASNFSLVSLSTGIGVASVYNGRVLDRRIELGHSLVESRKDIAQACNEHFGCWVGHGSGWGITQLLKRENIPTSIEDFFKNPDPKIVEKIRNYTAIGLTHIIHAFDPDVIVIMGSLGLKQFDFIIPSAKELEKHVLFGPIPEIVKSNIGDDIGVLGAFEYAKELL